MYNARDHFNNSFNIKSQLRTWFLLDRKKVILACFLHVEMKYSLSLQSFKESIMETVIVPRCFTIELLTEVAWFQNILILISAPSEHECDIVIEKAHKILVQTITFCVCFGNTCVITVMILRLTVS